MPREFQLIQLALDATVLKTCEARRLNQLAQCMHVHNELSVLNRIMLFSINTTSEGNLHNSAQSVQMWCFLQILAAKLYESWDMVCRRFLKSNPEDSILLKLDQNQIESLTWAKSYFGTTEKTKNALRTIRDKTAFHYDKFDLTDSIDSLSEGENLIYLAQHPANSLYYLGSSLVFRSAFAKIADQADAPATLHSEKTREGFEIALQEVSLANLHLNQILYGIIDKLLEEILGRPLTELNQVRIPISGAPDPDEVGLPTFISIGRG